MNDLLIKAYIKGSNGVERARNFLKDERGVTAVEYAIVLAGVAAVVAVIFGKGGTVQKLLESIFSTVSTQVKDSMANPKQP
ncbi:Flp family type IVb pilin [Enterobacter sp.]|uniref:Flp family type IVb pilin n=1 Tax=Enterobacter sp. TaxID=42895 RepID=UPI00296EBBD5|nr:Flp family type IVb pilin [Enterobacter sp.]